MKLVYLVLTVVYGLAWKCGVIVIAVALLAAMVPGEVDDPAGPIETGSTRSVAATTDKVVRVTMNASATGIASKCTLVDDQGRQLLQVAYDWNGGLWVGWGDAFPFQMSGTAVRDGSTSVVARYKMHTYELALRPDGVSGLTASDDAGDEYRGLGFTKEGKLVVDPRAIGSFPNQEGRSAGNQDAAARSNETMTSCP